MEHLFNDFYIKKSNLRQSILNEPLIVCVSVSGFLRYVVLDKKWGMHRILHLTKKLYFISSCSLSEHLINHLTRRHGNTWISNFV